MKFNVGKQSDPTRISVDGSLFLGNISPGIYTLQVLIYDDLADKKNSIATQTFEFEIVE
jgi:hypothetical protein